MQTNDRGLGKQRLVEVQTLENTLRTANFYLCRVDAPRRMSPSMPCYGLHAQLTEVQTSSHETSPRSPKSRGPDLKIERDQIRVWTPAEYPPCLVLPSCSVCSVTQARAYFTVAYQPGDRL